MQYNAWDLGQLGSGAIVEVNLSGSEANVKLLDSLNFSAYKSGNRHTYYGGLYSRSPIRLPVPHGGHWFVTIDYGGFAGSGRASVRVLTGV